MKLVYNHRYPYPWLHARLRLGSHALNEYLFKINCYSSPICHCGIENETVEHYFLYCPRFAAQRASLFASAERMCVVVIGVRVMIK